MAHIEQTRAVVEPEEAFDGRIFPTEQAELDRPVRLRPDSRVQGSVYGNTIEGDPNATVEGSVMASESVELEGTTIEGEVGTPGRVLATESRIQGTVTGTRVRLTDCVVRGNVVGSQVILEDCIVLGIVSAERELALEGSLCYTFRSHGETTAADATVVLPQAIADGPLSLETPIAVAGLGEISVESADEDRLPRMDETDRYAHHETRYLTLAPRVLNLETVTDRLDELERAILTTVDDTSREEGASLTVDDVLESLDVGELDLETPD